jgi:hypothetical protein
VEWIAQHLKKNSLQFQNQNIDLYNKIHQKSNDNGGEYINPIKSNFELESSHYNIMICGNDSELYTDYSEHISLNVLNVWGKSKDEKINIREYIESEFDFDFVKNTYNGSRLTLFNLNSIITKTSNRLISKNFISCVSNSELDREKLYKHVSFYVERNDDRLRKYRNRGFLIPHSNVDQLLYFFFKEIKKFRESDEYKMWIYKEDMEKLLKEYEKKYPESDDNDKTFEQKQKKHKTE